MRFRDITFTPFGEYGDMRTLCVAFAAACAVSIGPVSAGEAAASVTLEIGFGGAITGVTSTYTAGAVPACPRPLGALQIPLFAAARGATAVCAGASAAGLEIEFALPDDAPISFAYPSRLHCVTLDDAPANAMLISATFQTADGRPPVRCDVTRAYLYALAVERHGWVTPVLLRAPASRWWKSAIVVPWSMLRARERESRLQWHVFAGGQRAPVGGGSIDLTTDGRSGAASLSYAPIPQAVTTPAPGQRRPRLQEIQSDLFYSPDDHLLLAATFADNDAAANVRRALSQVVSNAILPLPAARIVLAGPELLNTRTQPLPGFLKPSAALGDDDLRLIADAVPFRLSKIGSLASGYWFGYASDVAKAGAFYGLKQPGQFNEAYGITLGGANDSGESPATLDLLHSVVANEGYLDDLSGVAAATNFYHHGCIAAGRYCTTAFHLFASTQVDGHPRATSPITVAPPNASGFQFAGASGSYTEIRTPDGAPARFVQVAETLGVQEAAPFYAPTGGSIVALSALGGVVGHVVLSYGAGSPENVTSVDVFGSRLTTRYGDAFTDVAEQLTVPFAVAATAGWSAGAGVHTDTLSSRVAEMQQGLVPSYFAAVYPTAASVGAPVSAAVVRPQTLANVTVASPRFTFQNVRDTTVQFDGAYQVGSVSACQAVRAVANCSTVHADAATWALFANRRSLGIGISTMPGMSIPQDLAIASTPRYFGTYAGTPGAATTYLTYGKCVQATAAYANAAYPSGVPLPQRGTTVSAKIYYSVRRLGFEAGYSNALDAQNAALNQSEFYVMFRFTASLSAPAGCAA